MEARDYANPETTHLFFHKGKPMKTTTISVTDLQSIEKLSLQPNDLLLLRVRKGTPKRALTKLRNEIKFNFWEHDIRAHVLILEEGADVRHLNSAEMNQLGWVRQGSDA